MCVQVNWKLGGSIATYQVEDPQECVDSVQMWLQKILPVHLQKQAHHTQSQYSHSTAQYSTVQHSIVTVQPQYSTV